MSPTQGEVGTTTAVPNIEIGQEDPTIAAENVDRPSQAGRLRASRGRCPLRANAWDTNLMNKVIKKTDLAWCVWEVISQIS